MTVTTIFADTGDSNVRKSNANFATARGSASADAVQNFASSYGSVGKEGSTYNFYILFFMFDSSVIPSADLISDAIFSFYLVGDNLGTAGNQWAVTQGHQTTWNSLVVGDFSKRSNAPTGSVQEGAPRQNRKVSTESGYQDFVLNATGRGWVARSGETKPAGASASGKTQLVMAWATDIDNSAPATNDYNQVYMADQAGTTNDPKLVVTHGVAAGNSNFLAFM